MERGPHVAGESGRSYDVRLHREAARSYQRLHGSLLARVRAAIDALAVDPRPVGAIKLAGRDDYRVRVGDHRIVYAVDDGERQVIVARIAHRREEVLGSGLASMHSGWS